MIFIYVYIKFNCKQLPISYIYDKMRHSFIEESQHLACKQYAATHTRLIMIRPSNEAAPKKPPSLKNKVSAHLRRPKPHPNKVPTHLCR